MTIIATRAGFLVAGLGLAVWAPLVPFVRQRIPMSDAEFGLLLLSIGIGSLCCMPLTAWLTGRLGIRRTVGLCTLLLLAALFGVIFLNTKGTMALALFAFGGSMGMLDIALNLQGLLVENRAGRRMMSNFHGMFSLGTIVGSLLVTLLLMAGLSAVTSPLLAVLLIMLLLVYAWPGFNPHRTARSNGGWAWPGRWVILAGIMCFIAYLAEGAVLDWSALYLLEFKAVPTTSAGLGYVVFALAITLGRFTGDALGTALGQTRLMLAGGLLAAAGLLLSLAAGHWALSLAGFALCGLGSANISPLMISALNRQTRVPAHLAVTAATTIGFAGVLAGPALIGAIAHYSSLGIGFACVAAGLVVTALVAPLFRQMR